MVDEGSMMPTTNNLFPNRPHKKGHLTALLLSLSLLVWNLVPLDIPSYELSQLPSSGAFSIDAGGPYGAVEGLPIRLDASITGTNESASIRWDYEGDGMWDTDFRHETEIEHTWTDDFVGEVRVEARIEEAVFEAPVNKAPFKAFTFVSSDQERAQSFVAETSTIKKVYADVSRNNPEFPEDLLFVSIRENLSGPNLAMASVSPYDLPGFNVEHWISVEFAEPIEVKMGTTYYLVLTSPGSHKCSYEPHLSVDTYPNGTEYSRNPPDSWMQTTMFDLRFAVVGSGTQSVQDSASIVVQNANPTVTIASLPTFVEASPAVVMATASDPGSDDLTFTWNWGDGKPSTSTAYYNDGRDPDPYPSLWGTYPFSATDAVEHIYGDNGVFQITLTVSDDDGGTTVFSSNATVLNVLPSGMISILSSQQHEGSMIQFSAHVTDPGSDDLFLKWSWGYGAPDEYATYYNNGTSPDPYPSPEIHPRDITDARSHTYGDNGAFTVTVYVTDDDSGTQGTTLQITATPDNLPPSVSVTGGTSIDEGQSVILTGAATDPGSDDLTFTWTWGDGSSSVTTYYNNGVGPDPPNSPGGTFPFTAADTATHPYGDNGLFTVNLEVADDDGGSTTWSGQLTVINLPPIVKPFGPFTVDEGSPLSVSTSATDPGSDRRNRTSTTTTESARTRTRAPARYTRSPPPTMLPPHTVTTVSMSSRSR
jgi:hypothetical protein